MVATLSVLIVASRKHYTVDVVIAWYVVPLVFYAMLRRWTTKRPVSEEPWPHRSMAEDNALQLEEIVVHSNASAPEVCLQLETILVHSNASAPEVCSREIGSQVGRLLF